MLSRLFHRQDRAKTAVFSELQPSETEVVGGTIPRKGVLEKDNNYQRIEWLVENKLTKLAVAGGGWETLYKDSRDGRYWERTYPHSAMHGGGPPSLILVNSDVAKAKYDLSQIL